MAAHDRRARRGSEAEAGRDAAGAEQSSPPATALTCQHRRRPAADRRSPGARQPRHTRTGREGGAEAGARPARTSGGGRRGADWRRGGGNSFPFRAEKYLNLATPAPQRSFPFA